MAYWLPTFFLSFYGNDPWRSQTMIGLILCAALIGVMIGRATHWLVGANVFWIVASAVFLSWNPTMVYGRDFGVFAQTAIDSLAAQGAVYCLLITFAILGLRDRSTPWLHGFVFAALADAAFMIFRWAFFGNPTGLLSNAATDATFIAFCFPFLIVPFFDGLLTDGREDVFEALICTLALALPIFAILVSRSSTGITVLGAEIAITALFRDKTWRRLGLVVLAAPVAYVALTGWLGQELLNSNGRVNVWRVSWHAIRELGFYVQGAGTGTYQFLGVSAQKAAGQDIGFLWAHNEWLQTFFEQGAVGVLLLGALYLLLLKRSLNRPLLFSIMAGAGIASMTTGILRHVPLALFLATVSINILCDGNANRNDVAAKA